MNEADYGEGGDEDEDMKDAGDVAEVNRESTPLQSSEGSQHSILEELDPALVEWFRGGRGDTSALTNAAAVGMEESETESDHDSDNADMVGGNEDEDDWEKVKGNEATSESEDVQDVKMGETDDAMAYDEELIFKHL